MATIKKTGSGSNRYYKKTVLNTDQMNGLWKPLEQAYNYPKDSDLLKKALDDAGKFHRLKDIVWEYGLDLDVFLVRMEEVEG